MIRFPLKCAECRERRVVLARERYEATVDHDGRSYSLSIPDLELLKCESCDNRILPDAAGERVNEALRQAAGLLSPSEIKQRRLALHLTQKDLADHLRIAEATLSRWETGAQIQQRGYDILLRLFFDLSAVRDRLGSRPSKAVATEIVVDQVEGVSIKGTVRSSSSKKVKKTTRPKKKSKQ